MNITYTGVGNGMQAVHLHLQVTDRQALVGLLWELCTIADRGIVYMCNDEYDCEFFLITRIMEQTVEATVKAWVLKNQAEKTPCEAIEAVFGGQLTCKKLGDDLVIFTESPSVKDRLDALMHSLAIPEAELRRVDVKALEPLRE